MKTGVENRKMLFVALGLMALAMLLVARWVFSSGTPTSASVQAPTPAARVATPVVTPKSRTGKKLPVARSLDPTLHYGWLKASEDTVYAGKGRNIFQAQVDIPKPIHVPISAPVQQQPQGPPPPPPINLKFFGFANKPGEPKKVFLSQGEDVFIAAEGDIVDRRYKVLHISPVAVEVEDVLTNNRQSIPLTQG